MMKPWETLALSQMSTGARFRLMFGLPQIPEYPMPLTPEQRQDIHLNVLNYWNSSSTPISLKKLADLAIGQYELIHSPCQMERTNHALQLEIEALKAQLAAPRPEPALPCGPLDPMHAVLDTHALLDGAGVPKMPLPERVRWLIDHSQPTQTMALSPSGKGFGVKNDWTKTAGIRDPEFGPPPEGSEWINPAKLSPETVQTGKGWRLCHTGEQRDPGTQQSWIRGGGWKPLLSTGFGSFYDNVTYRTQEPITQPNQP